MGTDLGKRASPASSFHLHSWRIRQSCDDMRLPGDDGLGSQKRHCAIERSHLQRQATGQPDLAPVRGACVETRGKHYRLRQDDSRNLAIVMLGGKLARDVDRVAYCGQCARRVVTGLTDTCRAGM